MSLPKTPRLRPRSAAGEARRRLRARLWPIAQTAGAAVAAWYLAVLLLPADRPLFAPIAAVIAASAAHGQRGRQAAELIGGVILGIAVADLLVAVIGTGPWQIAVLVVLAMSAATALGGGELLVSEAAVSAILIAALEPVSGGLSPDRFFEALIGGGVAFASSSLLFPPDPVLHVGRAVNGVFGALGRTLQDVARALAEGDDGQALRALQAAREIDDGIDAVERELTAGRQTARVSPHRRGALVELERYERSLAQLDYAVRDTRVLARNVLRHLRGGAGAREELGSAVAELAEAVWALAAAYDDPRRAREVRRLALGAAGQVTRIGSERPELGLAEIVVQVRSIAVDLVRAAELAIQDADHEERPTDELLALP